MQDIGALNQLRAQRFFAKPPRQKLAAIALAVKSRGFGKSAGVGHVIVITLNQTVDRSGTFKHWDDDASSLQKLPESMQGGMAAPGRGVGGFGTTTPK
jgi:hypothetical protein